MPHFLASQGRWRLAAGLRAADLPGSRPVVGAPSAPQGPRRCAWLALGRTPLRHSGSSVGGCLECFESGLERASADPAACPCAHPLTCLQGVRVVASLPCYTPETTDGQRGAGVFERSIRGLQARCSTAYAARHAQCGKQRTWHAQCSKHSARGMHSAALGARLRAPRCPAPCASSRVGRPPWRRGVASCCAGAERPTLTPTMFVRPNPKN